MEEKETIKSGLKRRAINSTEAAPSADTDINIGNSPSSTKLSCNQRRCCRASSGERWAAVGEAEVRLRWQHVPRSRWKGAVSGKPWDKEESSEEPDSWGRRPDHAPGGLDLLTAALQ